MKHLMYTLKSLFFVCLISACKTNKQASSLKNIDASDSHLKHPFQEELGVCVSFGLTGLIENNFYHKTGISIDLSESLFFKNSLITKGEMYNVNKGFLDVASLGMTTEKDFPFSKISQNLNFTDTADQALQNPHSFNVAKSMEATIEKLTAFSGNSQEIQTKRKNLLDEDLYFGPLESSLILIPTQASYIPPGSEIPTHQGIECFSRESQPSPTVSISPQNFVKSCIKFDPSEYSSPEVEATGLFESSIIGDIEDRLKNRRAVAIGSFLRDVNTAVYSIDVLSEYIGNGLNIDLPNYYSDEPSYGHATLITGYLSWEDLNDRNQHNKGLLRGDDFEELSLLFDINLSSVRKLLYGSAYDGPSSPEIQDLIETRKSLFLQVENTAQDIYNIAYDAYQFSAPKLSSFQADMTAFNQLLEELNALEDQIIAKRLSLLSTDQKANLNKKIKAFKKLKKTDFFNWNASEYPFKIKVVDQQLQAVLKGTDDFVIKSIELGKPDEGLDEKRLRRSMTRLGQLIKKEKGIFIIRESFGRGSNSGVKGFYYMTYDYFLNYTDEIVWTKD